MRFLLFFSALLLAQSTTATLQVRSDLPARIEIDGKPAGMIAAHVESRFEVAPGDHTIQLTPEGSGSAWSQEVRVSSALPNTLNISLRKHLLRVRIEQQGYWIDGRTQLMWAARDSGAGVTVSQAESYCRKLDTAGFRDWRLPEIDQLQALFGGEPDERGFRVIAPLRLTGWSWSTTTGNEEAERWSLDLGDGARASVAAGDAGLNRALCVRDNVPGRLR